MPSLFPTGRCGTKRFCEVTGLARTTFLTRYRIDPYYIELFDIRIDVLNRLNMSEKAARAFGQLRAGNRPLGRVQRVPDVRCPQCDVLVAARRRICPGCQHTV